MTNRDVKPGPLTAKISLLKINDGPRELMRMGADGTITVKPEDIDAALQAFGDQLRRQCGVEAPADKGSLQPSASVPGEGHGTGVVGWQPIETAPRDGTEIILAAVIDGHVYEEPATGRWEGHIWEPSWQCNAVIEHQSDFGTNWHTFGPQPTHWMPLPPPPATATRNSGDEG